MFNTLNKTKEIILDILLPKRCVGCSKEGKYICDNCSVFLSESINDIDRLVSIWEYEGIVKKLIYNIKYEGNTHAIDELVKKAFEVMTRDISRFQSFLSFLLSYNTYITYVPMYKNKGKKRGFNQAGLIAKKVGEITKKEVRPLLIKIKDNSSQADLSEPERIENVRGVFDIAPVIEVKPQSVVLVNDVYATGATMRECQKVLRENGIKDIWSFVLARQFTI